MGINKVVFCLDGGQKQAFVLIVEKAHLTGYFIIFMKSVINIAVLVE